MTLISVDLTVSTLHVLLQSPGCQETIAAHVTRDTRTRVTLVDVLSYVVCRFKSPITNLALIRFIGLGLILGYLVSYHMFIESVELSKTFLAHVTNERYLAIM